MKIDHCLILAAGFGTRMGPIGSSLPKVLWEVFEKNLLHLQILYAKKLGVKKIFINLHHQKDQIKHFVDSLRDDSVELLIEEPVILDIGGGIHNLALKVHYQGKLLVINSDQFLLFPEKYLEEALLKTDSYDACLFGIEVEKSGKYNQTVIDDAGFLSKIIPEKEVQDEKFWTYSGVAVINLTRLLKSQGPSKFFDSVAPYKSEPIPFIKLKELSYWDFGTLQRYHQSMFKILKQFHQSKPDTFIEFLLEARAFDPTVAGENHYHSKSKGVIDLSRGDTEAAPGSIILKKPKGPIPQNKSVVVFDDIVVDI